MKTLYEASNSAEAHMLLELLRQQGISSHIQGEYLQGAVGGLPAIGLVRLVVEDKDFSNARAIIERWEATEVTPASAARKESPKYSGFAGFLLGLVVGVGGLYAIYKAPGTVDGVDHDRDGHLDEAWTYAWNT
ncbi:DUF2007 domain-containing protein [Pseudomonas sp. F(2018)]|uniref:putative signal transducing protein n=1 Tax=Pseudomonas sp. F(2018) TaxID=2502240 RepID=UPI001485605E|nr:DUF2007 domain-containing protein [Pseudomonas sp. F(2018)]